MSWPEWTSPDGRIRLINADCLEVRGSLPEVDAVVTDPPYGIGWQPRVNHQEQPWIDDKPFDPHPWLQFGVWHLFWGANYFADKLPPSAGWATWVKRPIDYDFSRDERSYATTELAWSDWGKCRFICHTWDGGMRAGSSINRDFCHPSQKPVEVMEWCLPPHAKTILDPFAGSCTTAIACIRTDRRCIAIEKEERYWRIGIERVKAEYARTALFDHAEAVA